MYKSIRQRVTANDRQNTENIQRTEIDMKQILLLVKTISTDFGLLRVNLLATDHTSMLLISTELNINTSISGRKRSLITC